MAISYYHKSGFNNKVHNLNGVAVEFERLADSQGVIAVDDDKDEGKADFAALELCVKKGMMGVTKINSAKYDELKKNLPYVKPGPVDSGFAIHDPQRLAGLPARSAKVRENLPAAPSAQLAQAVDTSEPQPISASRPVRTSKGSKSASSPTPVATPESTPPATTEAP